MKTKIRFFITRSGHATVQVWRPWFPRWLEKHDYGYPEVPGDYDPDYSYGEALEYLVASLKADARKYEVEYVGVVYATAQKTFREKVRSFFQGPCGYQGAMGAQGLPGAQGPAGRDAWELKCSHCKNYVGNGSNNLPRLSPIGGERYIYRCPWCSVTNKVFYNNGIFEILEAHRNVPRLNSRRRLQNKNCNK